MELMFKKHPVFLFLLVVTVPTIIGTGFAIKNEEYQQTKNVKLNFTKVDLGNKLSQIQCSRMCSEDSSCLGVGIQKTATGEVRCFKMKNDSSGDAEIHDELVYMKVTLEEDMADDVETCSAPWTRIGDLTGCYYVGTDQASWDTAEDACQNLDAQAHLVSFETDEELVAVTDYVLQNGGSAFRTGGKDHDGNNVLTWTGTGELLSDEEPFWNDSPYHYHGDCIYVYNVQSKLENTQCGLKYSFVCETM